MLNMHHDIFDTFPKLANAKQPPKLPIRSGQFSFNPAEEFAQLARQVECGTFRLRAPESRLDRLVGPFRGTGTCLSPVLQGQYLWIDPELEPADGDFVIVSLDPEELTGIIERGRDDPAWLATYGSNPGRVVTKILRSIGHEWYLAEREASFELTGFRNFGKPPRDNRVLGVVRAVMDSLTGRLLYEAPAAHAIGLNAATDVFSGSLVGPTTSGVQAGVFLTVAVPAYPFAHTTIVTLTGDFWRSSGGGVWVESDLHGQTTGGVTSEERFLTAAASPGERVTIQYEFSESAGVACDYNLEFNTGSPSNTITCQNVRLQAEVIKR